MFMIASERHGASVEPGGFTHPSPCDPYQGLRRSYQRTCRQRLKNRSLDRTARQRIHSGHAIRTRCGGGLALIFSSIILRGSGCTTSGRASDSELGGTLKAKLAWRYSQRKLGKPPNLRIGTHLIAASRATRSGVEDPQRKLGGSRGA